MNLFRGKRKENYNLLNNEILSFNASKKKSSKKNVCKKNDYKCKFEHCERERIQGRQLPLRPLPSRPAGEYATVGSPPKKKEPLYEVPEPLYGNVRMIRVSSPKEHIYEEIGESSAGGTRRRKHAVKSTHKKRKGGKRTMRKGGKRTTRKGGKRTMHKRGRKVIVGGYDDNPYSDVLGYPSYVSNPDEIINDFSYSKTEDPSSLKREYCNSPNKWCEKTKKCHPISKPCQTHTVLAAPTRTCPTDMEWCEGQESCIYSDDYESECKQSIMGTNTHNTTYGVVHKNREGPPVNRSIKPKL